MRKPTSIFVGVSQENSRTLKLRVLPATSMPLASLQLIEGFDFPQPGIMVPRLRDIEWVTYSFDQPYYEFMELPYPVELRGAAPRPPRVYPEEFDS